MPYCENCGSPVNLNAKFCGNCGTPRAQPASQTAPVNTPPTQQTSPPQRKRLLYYSAPTTPAPSAPPPIMRAQINMQAPTYQAPLITQPVPVSVQASGESVVGVVVFRKMKSLGRWDTYTGVVTGERLIFAQMTSDMIKDAAMQARDQAKADGKGFFGQWSDQLKATWGYSKKYLSMSPQAILAETPGNFALNNCSINEVKLKARHNQNNLNSAVRDFEVHIHSAQGKYEFNMDENSEFIDLLKRVYGDRVRMPLGYIYKSINIKF